MIPKQICERCYGFTAELDFILNGTIKDRIGRDTEGEEQ
jgi:hypothetical protein